jgi:hypothetical protein
VACLRLANKGKAVGCRLGPKTEAGRARIDALDPHSGGENAFREKRCRRPRITFFGPLNRGKNSLIKPEQPAIRLQSRRRYIQLLHRLPASYLVLGRTCCVAKARAPSYRPTMKLPPVARVDVQITSTLSTNSSSGLAPPNALC